MTLATLAFTHDAGPITDSRRSSSMTDQHPAIDAFKAFGVAMDQFAKGFELAGNAIGGLTRILVVAIAPLTDDRALYDRRLWHGGMHADAKKWPEQWMSTVCAGLICGITECPSDEYDLRCNCPHHRKE